MLWPTAKAVDARTVGAIKGSAVLASIKDCFASSLRTF